MKNLLDKIFNSSTTDPSGEAQKCLSTHFKEAKSIEWSKISNGFEAVFYINNQEYICHISTKGELLEYKINLNPFNLIDTIKKPAQEHGEIMNAISIHKPEQEVIYELIIRNKKLERFTVMFKSDGAFIKKIKL